MLLIVIFRVPGEDKDLKNLIWLLPALLENFAWLAWFTISTYVQLLLISSAMSIIDTTLMHWTLFDPLFLLSTITLHFSPKASSRTQNKTINFLNIFLVCNPPIAWSDWILITEMPANLNSPKTSVQSCEIIWSRRELKSKRKCRSKRVERKTNFSKCLESSAVSSLDSFCHTRSSKSCVRALTHQFQCQFV